MDGKGEGIQRERCDGWTEKEKGYNGKKRRNVSVAVVNTLPSILGPILMPILISIQIPIPTLILVLISILISILKSVLRSLLILL